MTYKDCMKCSKRKPLSEYYKHSEMKDGRLNKCKECTKKETRENRQRNIAYYKEYDRQRFQNDPRVRARHKRYQSTEAGRKSMSAANKRWEEKNPEKKKAHNKLNNAVRDGKIKKPERCQGCDTKPKRLEGHHKDYTKPLDVMWLCRSCHAKEHREW
jgi:hypothetical protein